MSHEDVTVFQCQLCKIPGTSVYRNKVFMDVGAGGEGYADFILGVAKKVILVELNIAFAGMLREKGYEVFAYMEDA